MLYCATKTPMHYECTGSVDYMDVAENYVTSDTK